MADGDIRHDASLGGGATLDLLIYPLSFALEAAGRAPERVTHHVVRHARHPVDGLGHVQLDWPEYSAQIRYGFGCSYRNEVLVWGDQGRIQLSRAFTPPPDLAQTIEVHASGGREEIRVDPADHFALMLADFDAKIRRQPDSGRNTGEDVLRRMVIIDEVAAAGRAEDPAPVVSVVIPVYRSEAIIQGTVKEIQEALAPWCATHEIVLVNDCSPDGSRAVLEAMAATDPRIRPVHLMRNFGQHNAIMAGLHQARGRFIVTMDDDGQHDPPAFRRWWSSCGRGATWSTPPSIRRWTRPSRTSAAGSMIGWRTTCWTNRRTSICAASRPSRASCATRFSGIPDPRPTSTASSSPPPATSASSRPATAAPRRARPPIPCPSCWSTG
jgi:hypothetical protein